LAIRALDRLVAEPIRGLTQTRGPFFSPDGNWIGFFQGTTELKKVAVAGGPSVLISRIPGTGPRGASWSTDGTIVFATSDPNTGLMRVPAGGGEAVVLTKPDAGSGEEDHVWPSVLPSGDAVIFTISAPTPENTQVALLDLATGKWKTLIRGGSGAHYVQSGHLVYGVGRTLYAVNFDPARRELTGYPVPVVDDVATVTTPGSAQAPDFTVSRSGTLVYAPASSSTGGLRTLVWVDREGREEPIGAPARPYSTVRLSPDATRIAADIRDKENDIWIWDLTRRTLGRLTFGPATDTAPLWFPDGRRLLYSSSGNLVSHSADGSGTPQSYSVPLGSSMPMSVSPDGKQLILVQHNDLMALSLEGQAKPITLIREFQGFAEISPDGRWIAYQTNESGQFQVYVRPFPRVDDGKWLISSGGRMPAWSRDGRELFFLENVLFGAQLSLMAVPIETDSGFKVGSPVKLIEGPYFAGPGVRGYDVTADGKRFLMVKEPGLQSAPDATPASLVVVVDWQEELKRRVPAKQ
jgi:serine/threonine-protein kinase